MLICIDYFSKYAWTISIKNKEAITVRNAIAQVFIQGYTEILQSDYGRNFINNFLYSYLISINLRHILGSPYHPQSLGAIEALIKQYKNIFQLLMIMQRREIRMGSRTNFFIFFISLIASVYTQQQGRFDDMY